MQTTRGRSPKTKTRIMKKTCGRTRRVEMRNRGAVVADAGEGDMDAADNNRLCGCTRFHFVQGW